ncbi:LytR/AlgR family response regulator transcription factor [Puia dinghuensis]|uniref:DNA-binding response regulator n=1 Tax=Puia dinghuensis TaxID=1792502 RepID=A0A8J2U8E0_9BACT|nr:LytTR family DNA-binding domain-containing protein [Puia dinghuensis]GGA85855.1 DNA-binding response regulator [Puia dinghuensis]
MMRCMVIDDEQLVRELLEDNIRQVPFLQWEKSCRNALEAMEAMQTTPVDLLFLDIQMPRVNGLQFLQTLTDPPLVILVTAYEQYALEGFNQRVVDYLLKPFSFERFLKACNRAEELFRLRQNDRASVPVEDFFVNVEYALVKIVPADVLYAEGVKDYVKIYLTTSARPVLTRMTLKALEEKLPSPAYVRTHKSFLVSVKKITTVKRDFVCIGEKEIPVSVSYKTNITRLLK